MKDYADWAIDKIGDGESQNYIAHKLYRYHALPCQDFYVKDLSLLGRDLNRTIIVDNISENFMLQPENGISIKSWIDDEEDTALMQLAPLLLEIVEQEVKDVKLALKLMKDQVMKMLIEGDEDSQPQIKKISFSGLSQNSKIVRSQTPRSDYSLPASTGAYQHAAYLDMDCYYH
jgi:CTD small phosphatase-like protein 2